jgi:hypothetical protein
VGVEVLVVAEVLLEQVASEEQLALEVVEGAVGVVSQVTLVDEEETA